MNLQPADAHYLPQGGGGGCITEVFTYGVILWCKTVYKYDFKFDVHHKMFVKVLLAPHCVSHILSFFWHGFIFEKKKSAMFTPMDCLIRQTAPPIIEVYSHLQGVSEVGFQVALWVLLSATSCKTE